MQSRSVPLPRKEVVVIGGGPAGLTAAFELTRHLHTPIVLESHDRLGGLARTEVHAGYHFDMGGHRFYTKCETVREFWDEILRDEFLLRPRLSRIFYKNRFFHYPLKPINALLNLGLVEGIRLFLSYLRWRLFPHPVEENFEQWVTNRFGKRLFETFFKTYTEKVWGIPCSELKAEWAAQRIKDLSFGAVLLNMFWRQKGVKSLIEQFHYPRRGPGMLWEEVGRRVEEAGGIVWTQTPVQKIFRTGDRIDAVEVLRNDRAERIDAEEFLSSMPIAEFVKRLEPAAPAAVLAAARQLHHRDFLTVCLVINQKELFPDNWIYVHDPAVHVGRIQNFKNWSPDMVADPNKTSLGLEYFCAEGDDFWRRSNDELVEIGKRELEQIGLCKADDVEMGCVFRVPKAYPVYDSGYREALQTVRAYVDGLTNLQTIGRNGLHRYNNQDHAMLTGMLAVRNLVHGQSHDLWAVNAEQEYLEQDSAAEGQPAIGLPVPATARASDSHRPTVAPAFARASAERTSILLSQE